MTVSRRIVPLALALGALLWALSLGPAAPAQAMHCQPEEHVLGESPLGPDDRDPRCAIYQTVRDICLVRDLIGCSLTVGDVIDQAAGGDTGLIPTGAVPQEVRDICLVRDLIGCSLTVGDVLDELP